jgi:choline dehydrogenase-like flavoprotein
MNHVRCENVARLRLNPEHPRHLTLFRQLTEGHSRRSGCTMQIGLRLDETTQREEALLNAGAFFYAASAPGVTELRGMLDAVRRRAAANEMGRTDLPRLARLARGGPFVAAAALARLRRRPFRTDSLVMVEQIEQAPRADSRIMLDDGRDSVGRRRVKVQWRMTDATLRTQRRFHQLLSARVHAEGVGRLESPLVDDPEFEPWYGDAAHPMGSTRMAPDPGHGVVDTNCRVHALGNLFVAGSSVFPIGGQANPTLAIVALALRLAEHLRSHPPA